MSFFDSLFSNKDAVNAANAANAGLQRGFSKAKEFYGQGVDTYNQYADKAGAKFDPFYSAGVNANNMYTNALGLGGAKGTAAARNAFKAGPGFDFMLDTGLQSLDRGAASRGLLGSGNLLQAEQKYGSDLANQEYQKWLENLWRSVGSGQQAAGSQAAILTGQGQTGYNANADLGKLKYQAESQMGANLGAAEMANQTAAQNIFGAITSGLSLAGSVIGALPGGLGGLGGVTR
jgi:hypothetical protein